MVISEASIHGVSCVGRFETHAMCLDRRSQLPTKQARTLPLRPLFHDSGLTFPVILFSITESTCIIIKMLTVKQEDDSQSPIP